MTLQRPQYETALSPLMGQSALSLLLYNLAQLLCYSMTKRVPKCFLSATYLPYPRYPIEITDKNIGAKNKLSKK